MDGIEDFMLTQDQPTTSEDKATMPLSPPEEQASQRPESHAAAVAPAPDHKTCAGEPQRTIEAAGALASGGENEAIEVEETNVDSDNNSRLRTKPSDLGRGHQDGDAAVAEAVAEPSPNIELGASAQGSIDAHADEVPKHEEPSALNPVGETPDRKPQRKQSLKREEHSKDESEHEGPDETSAGSRVASCGEIAKKNYQGGATIKGGERSGAAPLKAESKPNNNRNGRVPDKKDEADKTDDADLKNGTLIERKKNNAGLDEDLQPAGTDAAAENLEKASGEIKEDASGKCEKGAESADEDASVIEQQTQTQSANKAVGSGAAADSTPDLRGSAKGEEREEHERALDGGDAPNAHDTVEAREPANGELAMGEEAVELTSAEPTETAEAVEPTSAEPTETAEQAEEAEHPAQRAESRGAELSHRPKTSDVRESREPEVPEAGDAELVGRKEAHAAQQDDEGLAGRDGQAAHALQDKQGIQATIALQGEHENPAGAAGLASDADPSEQKHNDRANLGAETAAAQTENPEPNKARGTDRPETLRHTERKEATCTDPAQTTQCDSGSAVLGAAAASRNRDAQQPGFRAATHTKDKEDEDATTEDQAQETGPEANSDLISDLLSELHLEPQPDPRSHVVAQTEPEAGLDHNKQTQASRPKQSPTASSSADQSSDPENQLNATDGAADDVAFDADGSAEPPAARVSAANSESASPAQSSTSEPAAVPSGSNTPPTHVKPGPAVPESINNDQRAEVTKQDVPDAEHQQTSVDSSGNHAKSGPAPAHPDAPSPLSAARDSDAPAQSQSRALADEIDDLLRGLEASSGVADKSSAEKGAARSPSVGGDKNKSISAISAISDILASEPVYLYTSLAGGGFHMPSRTNRLAHILSANRVDFSYRDLGTDDEARRVWKRFGRGRSLPAVVRGRDDIIGNWEEMDQANEDYRVRELIYETL
ncbi:Aip5p [Lachancea thermotolerans CBS 6340]|uniref:KLTH0H11484p n=1 Tax=Lachancea thermotolerans (strain ATCC 56472 / CBS 6340 / NRRL Y-8284) TaxID=559295 RepID=C5E396_LACTC|nr:KLTH0H11484p [Lachancea thermotolerans CBS 6340]CAR30507.1 KLTH0H11484p [Lachancea thermotolerans CBS 6340]